MKQKTLLIIICFAALVIVCCLFAGGYLLRQTQLTHQSTQTAASDTTESDDISTLSYETLELDGTTYFYNDDLRNYLFLGIDKRDLEETETGHANAGQCDALFLISWNEKTGQTTVLSIPRDTITEITQYSYDGQSHERVQDHISLSFAYGDGQSGSCVLSVRAVSNLLGGIPITGYMALDLDSLPTIIDTVGSFDVVLPNDSLTYADASLTEGTIFTVTADNIEMLVRSRDSGENGSPILRMERQTAFLEGLLMKMTEDLQQNASVTSELFLNLSENMISNISETRLNDLMMDLAENGVSAQETIPGTSVTDEYDEFHVDQDALNELLADTFYIKK